MGIVVALSSFLNPSPDWSHGLLSSGAPLGHMVRMGLVDLLPRGVAPGYHIARLWCAVADVMCVVHER